MVTGKLAVVALGLLAVGVGSVLAFIGSPELLVWSVVGVAGGLWPLVKSGTRE